MEKQAKGQAFVFALTYSEETEHSRRSARVFDYKDVQDLLKNLRRQVEYHLKRTSVVSFIACGEKGERFGRCHWHLCVFSEVDLLQIGKWTTLDGVVTDRKLIVSPPGRADVIRCNWSLWPHGFVTAQEPDYGGFRYALAYALKDQFNFPQSERSARAAKAEVFGEGYFVPSKRPMIGQVWVDRYIETCAARGLVPPTLALSVEGLNKPFWPTGLLADRVLVGLRLVNENIRRQTGSDGAGWSSLIQERADSVKHLELLGVSDVEAEERQSEALYRFRPEDKPHVQRWAEARRAFARRAEADLSGRVRGALAQTNRPIGLAEGTFGV